MAVEPAGKGGADLDLAARARPPGMRSGIDSSRPGTLGTHAYRTIRGAIRSGQLVPERRYSEQELATSMGMSRTPVREALIELAREGLIEVQPQRGFQLRALSTAEATEVFELRTMLESYVVRRLAKEATDRDIDHLRSILRRQREVIDDIDEFLNYDEEFHLAMPDMIGLWRTREMLFGLRGTMWLMGTQALELSSRTRSALAEHEAVVKAVANRDPKAAVAAMNGHLTMTSKAVDQTRARGRSRS